MQRAGIDRTLKRDADDGIWHGRSRIRRRRGAPTTIRIDERVARSSNGELRWRGRRLPSRGQAAARAAEIAVEGRGLALVVLV
jgi:hypothetical protein